MRKIPLLSILSLAALTGHSQLVINEIMQSNISVVYDDIKEYPDSWVELYNKGNAEVDLAEYSIGVKAKASKSYHLPSMTVAPGGYVLVLCDKVGNGLHADFRLESGKDGMVVLFHNDEPEDKIENIAKQPAPDISYGRETDGGNVWGYQLTPSPGKKNEGGIVEKDRLLPEPVFSVNGRVNGSPSTLTLSLPDDAPEGAEIRYSLDCSDVTAGHPVYNGEPIPLDGSVIVRARLFCKGYLSPVTTTHSYLHHYREMSLPVVSVTADNRLLYDSEQGILVAPLCYGDYRRPVNIEVFVAEDGDAVINQLCETRTGGGWTSRNRQQKTLMVYANKRFGEKRLDYEFFPDQRPGLTDYKSIMLRNAGNDYDHLYLRDAAIHRLAGMNLKGNLDWQAARPCVLYINGVYSGLRYIRERSNEDNIFTNYNGLEDIDMVENWNELKEGSMDSFLDFKEFYSEVPTQDMTDEYRRRLDVEEFLDVFALNFFYLNIDWPGNNFVLWRPQGEDGRWRAIIKDMDWTMGFNNSSPYAPQIKTLMDASDPAGGDTYLIECMSLFRNMMAIDDFRDMFIDRTLVFMADFMKPETTVEQMDYFRKQIAPEWTHHCAVAGIDVPEDKYEAEYDEVKDWLEKRWSFFYEHLSDYFSLGKAYPFELDMSAVSNGVVTVNGVETGLRSLKGKWGAGRKLSVKFDGADIKGWHVTETDDAGVFSTSDIPGQGLSYIMPEGKEVRIVPIVDSDHVSDIENVNNGNARTEYFDLSGRKLGTRPDAPGVYLLKKGESVSKVIVR